MHAISHATPTPPTSPSAALAPTGPALATASDELAEMRPSMHAALAVGRPTDAAGAATILGTAAGYLQGAGATIARLDRGIDERSRRLERLDQVDPPAAVKLREQIDLLQRLRDRIQLSIERVSDILAGRDRPDAARGIGALDGASQLGTLEARRQLLAPHLASASPAAAPALVATTYTGGASGR